ncbi:MAG: DUF4336 domain-containing protein [Bauldia sp.]|nr:DUF4336 domain-containing protein [Bauldia sp.]
MPSHDAPAGLPVPFGPEIWTVAGPPITGMLRFVYPTRMIVIRLGDGGLLLWSPVALTEAGAAGVATLGPVRHLVAPNTLHYSFIADWHRRYPAALVHALPRLRADRPEVPQGPTLDEASQPWAGEIDQVLMRTRIADEMVFFHRTSGTAIFTDLLQNFPTDWFPGWRRIVARFDLMLGDEPRVPRKFRLAITDRGAARTAIGRVLSWPVERVLMAHGEPVTTGAAEYLRRAFAWLNG